MNKTQNTKEETPVWSVEIDDVVYEFYEDCVVKFMDMYQDIIVLEDCKLYADYA